MPCGKIDLGSKTLRSVHLSISVYTIEITSFHFNIFEIQVMIVSPRTADLRESARSKYCRFLLTIHGCAYVYNSISC